MLNDVSLAGDATYGCARSTSETAPAYAAVRMAAPSDEEDLVAMLRLMHKEGGLRDGANRPFPISEDRMRGTVQRAIVPNRNDPDAGKSCCGIIGEPGRLEASICLGITSAWYSDTPFLGDLWLFVQPEYRRHTSHYKTLVAFAKVVAKSLQMPLLMGNVGAERIAAKDRLLERTLGGERFGCLFLYNPDNCGAL